ncbi:hypothetical protein FOWG_14068 [Fusarium oxysporum f. sp. lycopersici MN25]|jgi:hypothetical protein|nr:hypothetical protein FOWG_14068 [Fusarium oxysporum f. sp. lycopersici MN25]
MPNSDQLLDHSLPLLREYPRWILSIVVSVYYLQYTHRIPNAGLVNKTMLVFHSSLDAFYDVISSKQLETSTSYALLLYEALSHFYFTWHSSSFELFILGVENKLFLSFKR